MEEKELENLKKKYGELTQITVDAPDGSQATCYLKRAERVVVGKALSLVTSGKILEAGEVIIQACFVGGDERCKPNLEASPEDEDISIAACIQASNSVNILNATIKKIPKI